MAVASAAVTAYAASQVVEETGGTRVFALVFASLGLLNTLMFGAAWVKSRNG
jgi:hypothetical protein